MSSGIPTQQTGRFDRSIVEATRAIELEPDYIWGYLNLAWSHLYLGRAGDAERAVDRASERKLTGRDVLLLRYYIALLHGDAAGMERQVAAASNTQGAAEWMAQSQSLVLARSGRLGRARGASGRAVELATRNGERELAATYTAGAAVWEALFENASAARRLASAALAVSRGRDVEYGAAFALALAGDDTGARTLVNDLARRFSEDTSVQFNYLPTVRALLALHAGAPQRALDLLQPAARYEFAVPAAAFPGFFGSLYPVYVRGLAHLAAHHGVDAAVEFQKILDHRGLVLGDPVDAMARLQLARALASAGDWPKARAAYGDVLSLWKDADADLPLLKRVRQESARVMSSN